MDLSKPLGDDEFETLNDLLLEHQVLFVRGQRGLSDAAHLALAQRLGEPSVYPISKVLGVDQALDNAVLEEAAQGNF